MRDFSVPEKEEEARESGSTPTRQRRRRPGKGIVYAWWNGDGTFLGNPIGDNPNGADLYSFYKVQHRWPEFAGYDYAAWYEKTMRPIARKRSRRSSTP